jgi:glutathione S-transferase
MKTTPEMNDAERKAAWEQVDTLEEAVEEALAHPDWAASSDPYFADMTDAIWEMLKRCHDTRTIQ